MSDWIWGVASYLIIGVLISSWGSGELEDTKRGEELAYILLWPFVIFWMLIDLIRNRR